MTDIERLEEMFRKTLGSHYEGSDTQRRLQRIRAEFDARKAENTALQQQCAAEEQRIADLYQERQDFLENWLKNATPHGTA